MQQTMRQSSRTFSDHESVESALERTRERARGRAVGLGAQQRTRARNAHTERARAHATADVVGLFEVALRENKVSAQSVTYALQDLNDYVDTHVELCALVYGGSSAASRARRPVTADPDARRARTCARALPKRFNPALQAYVPHDQAWLKDHIAAYLQRQAGL